MNRPIRRVGYAVTILILLLVAQLTYLQVVDADNLAHDTLNVRGQLKEYNRARGKILTADGQIVAQSVPTTSDPDYKYRREYPQLGLFAHVAGYQSFVNLVGSTGVEASYGKVLTGQDTSLQLDNLGMCEQRFVGRIVGNSGHADTLSQPVPLATLVTGNLWISHVQRDAAAGHQSLCSLRVAHYQALSSSLVRRR